MPTNPLTRFLKALFAIGNWAPSSLKFHGPFLGASTPLRDREESNCMRTKFIRIQAVRENAIVHVELTCHTADNNLTAARQFKIWRANLHSFIVKFYVMTTDAKTG